MESAIEVRFGAPVGVVGTDPHENVAIDADEHRLDLARGVRTEHLNAWRRRQNFDPSLIECRDGRRRLDPQGRKLAYMVFDGTNVTSRPPRDDQPVERRDHRVDRAISGDDLEVDGPSGNRCLNSRIERYHMTSPPFGETDWPIMKLASSDAR